jgi:hypothetical protein
MSDAITLVSGLPRSGTSMMMKMLEAGGMAVMTDNVRTADEDNPKGYYEFERVKKIETDKAWLPDARGKAVKMISALLKHLPETERFKVVFMRRHMDEVLASQRKMLERRGKPADPADDAKMAAFFAKHLEQIQAWLASRANVEVLYVSYNDMIADPKPHCDAVARFVGGLDAGKMAAVADRELHRNRA